MKTKALSTLICLCAVFSSLILIQNPCRAIVVYVSLSGNDSDGSSWANAYKTIQQGVDKSNATEVRVQGYVGAENNEALQYPRFNAKNGVSVYGGYTGSVDPTTQEDLRDADGHPTVVSGKNSSDCVIYVPSGVGNATVVDGLDITNGVGRFVTFCNYGGGIYCLGSPTIQNCHIHDNAVGNTSQGGGIFAGSGTLPKILNNVIENNSGGYGGGIQWYGGTCTGNTIRYNTGVGIFFGNYWASSTVCTDNTISYNTDNVYGGGVYITAGATSSSTFSKNTVSNNTGGGVRSYGPCTISLNTITGNIEGRGVWMDGSNLLSNKITGNLAGGVFWRSSYSSPGTVANNLIASNSAVGNGGGISISLGTAAALVNNTIADNTTTVNGSGVYYSSPVSGSRLSNNIIMNNNIYATGTAYACYKNCMYATGSNTNYPPATCTDITDDPQFASGKPYHLTAGSLSCIDKGYQTGILSTWRDIDNEPRQVDIPDVGDTGIKVDIGADEYYPDYTTTPMVDRGMLDASSSGTLNATDGSRSNIRWASSATGTCTGDDFTPYSGCNWIIDELVAWGVPDIPIFDTTQQDPYVLGEYFSAITLYVRPATGTGTTNTVIGTLSPVQNQFSAVSPSGEGQLDNYDYPGKSWPDTQYLAADGTYNRMWRIDFRKLNIGPLSGGTKYVFAVQGTPISDRLWFNHALYQLSGGDGSIRIIDPSTSGSTLVSGSGWFGKDSDINVQIFAHPQ